MKVTACITTRDGKPDWIVYRRLSEAAKYAAKHDIEVDTCVSADAYSVAVCRNRAVAAFLQDPSATHLFFLDNDVHIQEDALTLLAGMDAPIAAGCYPSFKTPPRTYSLHKPYITVQKDGVWYLQWWQGPRDVDAAGTGCMLIRRDVLEYLGYPWFVWREWLEDDGEVHRLSDDIDFCRRATEAGFNIKAHGNVRCGHIKQTDAACFIFEDRTLDIQWNGPLSLRAQNSWPEYGSHVPALQAALKYLGPCDVVEYGAGRFSTPEILRHDVNSLTTYESDFTWVVDTQTRNNDERLTVNLCPVDRMCRAIHEDADLVFIDCDTINEDGGHHMGSLAGRIDLLKAYESTDAVVIIHDYNFADVKPHVDAANYTHRLIYKPLAGPETAILSNSVDVSQWDVPHSQRYKATRRDAPALAV